MNIRFDTESDYGRALVEWLDDLDANHGDRAEIRRCRSADEVAFQPAFARFCVNRIQPLGQSDAACRSNQLAAVCGLTAHLKPDNSDVLRAKASLARQMAAPRGDGAPRISELRFRRLLQYDRNDLYRPLLRIIRALDGAVNLYDLGNSVYYWGDKVRKRWAFDYFPNVKA